MGVKIKNCVSKDGNEANWYLNYQTEIFRLRLPANHSFQPRNYLIGKGEESSSVWLLCTEGKCTLLMWGVIKVLEYKKELFLVHIDLNFAKDLNFWH